MSTMSPTIDDLTVAEIDREVRELQADLDATSDPQVAGTIARRRQALQAVRPIAHAKEQAHLRQQRQQRVQVNRERFAVLEADLTADLRTVSSALERDVAQLAADVATYRACVARLGDVEDTLDPAPPGQGPDLLMALERMALDERLPNTLAAAGVLSHFVPAVDRGESWSLETFVAGQLRRFFDLAKRRLPPSAADDDRPDAHVASETPQTEPSGVSGNV